MGYYRLLKEASGALQGETGSTRRRRTMVSMALHPNQFVPPKLYQYIDRIHLMTYDMRPPQHGRQYHSSVESTKQAAQAFLERQCPPEKLVLGIPLYARHQQYFGDVKTLSEIADAAGSKALLETSSHNGYEFESQATLREKIAFVEKEGLGGVFFWEVGQDKQDASLGPGGVVMSSVANLLSSREPSYDEL